jgi:hypothetical protein
MKRRLPKVSTLFGVMAFAVAVIGPPLRIFSDHSPFTVSNIHFAVVSSDRFHVTATVTVSKGVDRPICHSQAMRKDSAFLGDDVGAIGPKLKAGQTWQLTSDLAVLNKDAATVDHIKIDCIDY